MARSRARGRRSPGERADDDETQQNADDIVATRTTDELTTKGRRKKKEAHRRASRNVQTTIVTENTLLGALREGSAQAAEFIVRSNERRRGSDVVDKPTNKKAQFILAAMEKVHKSYDREI